MSRIPRASTPTGQLASVTRKVGVAVEAYPQEKRIADSRWVGELLGQFRRADFDCGRYLICARKSSKPWSTPRVARLEDPERSGSWHLFVHSNNQAA